MNSSPPQTTTKQGTNWKVFIVVLVVIALISTGLWYWKAVKNSNAGGWAGGGPIDVVATTIKVSSAPVTIQALGEVRAVQQVTLASQVAGRVSKIHFESGQRVEAGTLLVQLDNAPERADLAAAIATTKFATAQLKRAKELVKTQAMSTETLQQRQAEFDKAAAQVEQIKARMSQLRIIAPFSGEIGLRQIDLGEYINPGDKAATLTALDSVYVNFDVPQQELARISVGQSVSIFSEIASDTRIDANITAIERQVNRNTRNVTIQAKVQNTQQLLYPGMYVTVNVNLPDEPDALILPNTAVMTSSNGNTVAIVRDISAEGVGSGDIVPVQVSRRIGEKVIIDKGLQPGDVVVTEGQLRVRPGAQLRVIERATTLEQAAM